MTEEKRMIRALFYDAHEQDLKEIEIDGDDYKAWNAKIGCDICEMPERHIGGTLYQFIVDEEFLYRHPDMPAAVLEWGPNYTPPIEIFRGNMIICKPEMYKVGEGEDSYEEERCGSLTDEDIKNIRERMIELVFEHGVGKRKVIVAHQPSPDKNPLEDLIR